jgi:16S rRNA (uracil1498-N3)-methyltransferase
MALPFFYAEHIDRDELQLDEDTSKHVVSVLRMKEGERINLTDGKGHLFEAEIIDAHKKRCAVNIVSKRYNDAGSRKSIIGISILKNTSRFEWFLEKATELGISEIIPMICDRTEKENFRYERMQGILISAMLQSQQVWLPVLHQPIGFGQLLRQEDVNTIEQRFIAHCLPEQKQSLSQLVDSSKTAQIVLIGPEGDFTKEEIDFALSYQFIPVSLGDTRLRAETAGMVAATILKLSV